MTIAFLGVNHRQARMQDIEAVYLNLDAKNNFLSVFCPERHINDCVILTTCNRFEIYIDVPDVDSACHDVCMYISELKQLSVDQVKSILNRLDGDDVMNHLFRVTAGLDSMVFGENEILTQVKDAYDVSINLGRTTGLFNKIFQTAVAVGKRVRAETSISRGSYSVSSIAIEAIREHSLDYFGHRIAVIGAGVIGKRCIKKLVALGHPDITVFNRTNSKAELYAKEEHIQWLPFELLESKIADFDCIITAVSSSEPILKANQFLDSENRTKLIVDLGLPRNADEKITEKTAIKLINVDGLREIAEKNVGRRKAEEQKVQEIIHDELSRFKHWESMRRVETH